MLLILSMVDTNVQRCDFCHQLDVHACTLPNQTQACKDCQECHATGMVCGPPAVNYHSIHGNGNYEREVENAEEDSLDHGHTDNYNNRHRRKQSQSACQAWFHLQEHQLNVYFQVATCLFQVVLACIAFSSGKQLANHRYFLSPADHGRHFPPSHSQRTPSASSTAAPAQVLRASVVSAPVYADDRPTLAEGEVMANAVSTNPLTDCPERFQLSDCDDCPTSEGAGARTDLTPPMATVVIATPIPRGSSR